MSRLTEEVYFPEVDDAGEAVIVGGPSEEQFAAAFDEFARTDGIGLVEWFGFRSLRGRRVLSPSETWGGGLIGSLRSRVHESAVVAGRLDTEGLNDAPRVVYDELEVRRRVRSVSDQDGRRVRAAGYRDLAERAAIEVDHLVFLAPRLSRCRLCGRIFVVARTGEPESHCRQALWGRDHPHPMFERCVPLVGAERERLRKSLHQKYRRALKRQGGDPKAPAVRKALKEYNAFMANHPAPPRGRRPDARPGLISDPNRPTDADSGRSPETTISNLSLFRPMDYVWEKTSAAVRYLATGTGTIQQRLVSVGMALHLLQSDDFQNNEELARWSSIMERLTALQELAGDEGSLEKSALALSDEQAYAVARDVLLLHEAHWSNLLEQAKRAS